VLPDAAATVIQNESTEAVHAIVPAPALDTEIVWTTGGAFAVYWKESDCGVTANAGVETATVSVTATDTGLFDAPDAAIEIDPV
jgi:hypothetical protein